MRGKSYLLLYVATTNSMQYIQSVGLGKRRKTLIGKTKALRKRDKYTLAIAEYHPFTGLLRDGAQ